MNDATSKAADLIYRKDRSKRLFHDRAANPVAPLGCSQCPHFEHCGGLNIEAQIWDCTDFCCGALETCDRVCRFNPRFADQTNEVGGFDLERIGQVFNHRFSPALSIVPTVYHSTARSNPLSSQTVSLRLADLYNFRTGKVRFRTRDALTDTFLIRPDAEIILCGIDHDRRVEPWWRLAEKRKHTIEGLMMLGINHVTTPNFSLMLNHPRMDDLHAMKRIGLIYEELVTAGLSASLHVNGRTDKDFERWGTFLRNRPGINQVVFEFSTGPGRENRMPLFISWLTGLAERAGRPLDIFVRGNPKCLPALRRAFERVIYIETTSFMRTTKRKIAQRRGNDRLAWMHFPSACGESLDELLEHNAHEQSTWLAAQFFRNAA